MSNLDLNKILLANFDLPEISDLSDLSYLMLLSEKLLYNLSKHTEKYYKTFYIEKKDGNKRKIDSPKYSLRVVQCWILVNILEKIPLEDNIMGFRKGSEFGIKKNANIHKNRFYILKMDLKDFFQNIKRFQVYNIFKSLGYSQQIANILTNYCTYNSYVPQGASTSPYISNLAFKNVDKLINDYCINNNILYTRYADDLIFSSNTKTNLTNLIPIVKNHVETHNFKINTDKTKLFSPTDRKIVTGLIVNNNNVKVKRKLKHDLRAMIFKEIVESGTISKRTQGYISFIKYIEGQHAYNKIETYIAKVKEKATNWDQSLPKA